MTNELLDELTIYYGDCKNRLALFTAPLDISSKGLWKIRLKSAENSHNDLLIRACRAKLDEIANHVKELVA